VADIAVAFTVSGWREKYLRQSLESWSKARGISEVQVVLCVEPAPSFPVGEFTAWVMRTFREPYVQVNSERLGCLRNTRQAFRMAFQTGASFGVMAEEDLVVSAGVVEYLTWAAEEYQQAPEVAAVCAHVRDSKSRDDGAVVRVPWFNPLVCGTWKDRWEDLLDPAWGPWEAGVDGNQAWDNHLRQVLRGSKKQSIFPARSRVTHIGETSTIYGSPVVSEFMFKESISACFSSDHRTAAFREVPFESVPGLLV
jgi:hypothetical protein